MGDAKCRVGVRGGGAVSKGILQFIFIQGLIYPGTFNDGYLRVGFSDQVDQATKACVYIKM
jgi:hypothetical protein